ncbi:branched-chain amino acid ABC transporter permease [Pararobbsia silviterrae]|uniref:Branched-chain amino acid ABC transporter permease n=1 Tax=Pararobbsia silviterrae TaxID=1792498 RepID=A0A494XSP3_9BURK|nr:branched-chain amino acid ABC transporter permease [Pararobbsia silviterrae]RKP51896.1 branched-chain amino acid ABC transporter permease [Pararobbsia silviterrae]
MAVLLVLALPMVLASGSLATELLIFALASMACNLLLGYTGLMSFGQGIFYGLGSYASGLLVLHLKAPLLLTLAGAMAIGAFAAAGVGWFAIRQRGIYFVMLTLAFSQMFYFLAYSLPDITGGDNGLLDIVRPNPTMMGATVFDIARPWHYYGFVAAIFVVVFVLMQRLSESRFGRTLLAIRDNEARAAAVGYDVRAFKLAAFVVSGAVTGLAGGLHALLSGIAPLSSIEYHVSETILLMTIIGGSGKLFASVIGAAVYVLAADWLSSIWPRWMLLLGLLLIAVALYMPQGIWGVLDRLARALRRGGEGPGARIDTHKEQA